MASRLSDEELRRLLSETYRHQPHLNDTLDDRLMTLVTQVRDLTEQHVEARLRGHGEPCYYCTKPINDLAANPGLWGIFLCHEDEPGVIKWHHVECVSNRLADLQKLKHAICPDDSITDVDILIEELESERGVAKNIERRANTAEQRGLREALEPIKSKLFERAAGQQRWLLKVSPKVIEEQKHLDEGTEARSYWHYGSMSALMDAVKLIEEELRRAADSEPPAATGTGER
jgi:hypothetical protein